MKSISLTALSLPLPSFLFTVNARAQEGMVLRMSCGAAGVVTVSIGSRIPYDEQYHYTNIYSSGLNDGAKNLRGLTGAAIFSVNDEGYSFYYGSGGHSFSRYGKEYKCYEL